jgi:hypothetical protein
MPKNLKKNPKPPKPEKPRVKRTDLGGPRHVRKPVEVLSSKTISITFNRMSNGHFSFLVKDGGYSVGGTSKDRSRLDFLKVVTNHAVALLDQWINKELERCQE